MTNQIVKPGLSFLRPEFITSYLITMRPYLLFVSGITGLAGLSLASETASAKLLLVGPASFLSYGFGQALTDCFQTDTDSISAPYRPLIKGTIAKKEVLVVSLMGLAGCSFVFAAYNPASIFFGGLAVGGLATYTPFKRKWWGGPIYNALIVVLLCLMAYASGAGLDAFGPSLHSTQLAWTLLAVFFGYANFVLIGYFKDIAADRATDYHTLPVVFGRTLSAWVSDLFAVCAICFTAFALNDSLTVFPSIFEQHASFFLFLGGVSATLLAQVRLHNVKTDKESHRAISPCVHAYILLLSSIVSAHQSGWMGLLVAFYLAFVLVLNTRPAQDQI